MGYIQKLDAINHMLLMAGESVVTSAQYSSGGLDVSTADSVLDRYIEDFTMRGLVGNRVLKKTTLSVAGKILLGTDQILSGELVSYHENTDGFMIQAQVRGQSDGGDEPNSYLYNITDQTDQWDPNKEYTFEITYVMIWDDIDTPLQRAIMAAAARQYQIIMQGDADADAYLQGMEAMYSAKAKASNIDDRRRSVASQLPSSGKRAMLRSDLNNNPARFRYWSTWNG
jgi:hypothetical protein